MSIPFYNVHSHIFTVAHAPDYFLQTKLKNKAWANRLRLLLTAKAPKSAIKALATLGLPFGLEKNTVNRYIEFFSIGLSGSQEDVYRKLVSYYSAYPDYNLVVLTQVLDFMDLEDKTSTHIHIETQVEEVAQLKRNPIYTPYIRPFLGCDPRMKKDLWKEWALKYISNEYGFCGIKLYPAYGFFPFDKRMDSLWAWAEEYQIPIMTHTTRSGTWYLGRFESVGLNESLIDQIFDDGNLPVDKEVDAKRLIDNIKSRIRNIVGDKKIQKHNDRWCNVYGHPENFELLLLKYPKLKICFAHFGGAEEVTSYDKKDSTKIQEGYESYLGNNWTGLIIDLINRFENIYTDVSFTISDIKATKKIKTLIDNNPEKLPSRILFGTDFFVVQTEKNGTDIDMIDNMNKDLTAYVQNMSADNPKNYLANNLVNF